jgi:hypothetical protein
LSFFIFYYYFNFNFFKWGVTLPRRKDCEK